jgi:hypothetical protein
MAALGTVCPLIAAGWGCSSDDDKVGGSPPSVNERPAENTGSACVTAADCFAGIDQMLLAGEVQCLDRVCDGYCTHLCETDEDCCATPGECAAGIRQVCSPFESTGLRMCFLSCESDDIANAPDAGAADLDDQAYCQSFASADFICRSSGGGSDNRKVCVPTDCNVGATCATDGDCAANLACILDFRGGYCGARDCQSDDDCPGDAACVTDSATNYCLRACNGASDCSLCRGAGYEAACTSDVTVAGASSGTVCLPSR